MTTPSLSRVLCVLLLITSPFAALAHGQNRLDPVAPFLDEHTLAVAHVDLAKVDPAALVKMLGDLAPEDDTEFPKRLAEIEERLSGVLRSLQQAGIREIYGILNLADLPKEPLLIVAPVQAGKDPDAAVEVVARLIGGEQTVTMHGVVVTGMKATVERLKTFKPADRPDVAKAFERAGDSAAQLVFAPTEDTRRVLREMLPRLPDEVGGGSGKMLVDGLQWAVISANPPPRLSLDLTVQSKDPDAAAALRGIIISSLQLVGKREEIKREIPQFNDLAVLLTPRLSGDQLRLTLNDKNGGAEQVLKLLTRPLQAARVAAGRSQSVNNLKQLALSLHNYHDVYGRLPARASLSKDGKPLLSWRVAVLPFLEQQPLNSEFKLDEPWDSEHNLKLVSKMPAVFASPSLTDEMRAKGLTSYLAPVYHSPDFPDADTVFGKPEGISLAKITDGTSNTIALVEAHPKQAVVWTKPDDLVIDAKAKDLFAGLRGQPDDGFNAVLCDGSVRFIKTDIDVKAFVQMLLMNDGSAFNFP